MARYEYDPWGVPLAVDAPADLDPVVAAQPLRYRGYYFDAETGLYYLPARYYDPVICRFLSADPAPPSAGDPASLNRYAYCNDDPVDASDPSGATADYDGNGKLDSSDTALEAATRTKNPYLKGLYTAKALASYYGSRARNATSPAAIEAAQRRIAALNAEIDKFAGLLAKQQAALAQLRALEAQEQSAMREATLEDIAMGVLSIAGVAVGAAALVFAAPAAIVAGASIGIGLVTVGIASRRLAVDSVYSKDQYVTDVALAGLSIGMAGGGWAVGKAIGGAGYCAGVAGVADKAMGGMALTVDAGGLVAGSL